jgi:hypothetical protein
VLLLKNGHVAKGGWIAWGTGLNRRFLHETADWYIEHCGHPTAHHPWALYAPDGQMVCQGERPEWGTAWDTVIAARTYVEKRVEGLEHFEAAKAGHAAGAAYRRRRRGRAA